MDLVRGLTRMQIATAALIAQPFTFTLALLRLILPPSPANWSRADPILLILPRQPTLLLVPLAGVLAAAIWTMRVRPTAIEVRRGLLHAAFGAVVAIAIVIALRILAGPHLPSFIPAEESAGPGLLLGLTAGYAEEVIFRLILLPLAFFALARRTSSSVAIGASVVITGLGFALLHQAGPGPSSPAWFATRFLIPGCAMSAACFAVSPSFIVGAHCTAHLLIPNFFV
jgi:hypothetical protein